MSQESTTELAAEARRTTHAVRAIARFTLLFATYQVIASLLALVGTAVALGSPQTSLAFYVVAGLISLWGIVHSLSAGYEELSLSDPPFGPDASTGQETSAAHLTPSAVCTCTTFERGLGGVIKKDGVKTCRICNKPIGR